MALLSAQLRVPSLVSPAAATRPAAIPMPNILSPTSLTRAVRKLMWQPSVASYCSSSTALVALPRPPLSSLVTSFTSSGTVAPICSLVNRNMASAVKSYDFLRVLSVLPFLTVTRLTTYMHYPHTLSRIRPPWARGGCVARPAVQVSECRARRGANRAVLDDGPVLGTGLDAVGRAERQLRVRRDLERDHRVARGLERDRLSAPPARVLPQGVGRVRGCVARCARGQGGALGLKGWSPQGWRRGQSGPGPARARRSWRRRGCT